jgi:pimeloyl-ACP methyl ester carboxylesterase
VGRSGGDLDGEDGEVIVHLTDMGDGVPLVLLHAFPVDSRMWDQVRGPLAETARVITPDQRGLGRSPLPDEADAPSMDAVAGDVLALLDELGLERAVLGGCSMGGYVAMAALRKAPHRVSGLLLIDTRPDADDDDRRAGRLTSAERVEREGTAWLADTLLPGLLASGTPDVRPDLAAWLRALIIAQPATGVAWAQRAMAARPDSTGVLRSFSGPALVLVGERDALSPPTQAREMAGLLAAGELVEVPGCGHLSPIEAPDEVTAVIARWLARIEYSPAR